MMIFGTCLVAGIAVPLVVFEQAPALGFALAIVGGYLAALPVYAALGVIELRDSSHSESFAKNGP
jgi:hypothetical protein